MGILGQAGFIAHLRKPFLTDQFDVEPIDFYLEYRGVGWPFGNRGDAQFVKPLFQGRFEKRGQIIGPEHALLIVGHLQGQCKQAGKVFELFFGPLVENFSLAAMIAGFNENRPARQGVRRRRQAIVHIDVRFFGT